MKPQLQRKQIAERNRLLRNFIKISEIPLMLLGFVWLVLLVIELLNKTNRIFNFVSTAIWIIFILDFVIKLFISTSKIKFLERNVLTIISLIIPAIRVFRLFRIIRFLRFTRGIRLVKMIGSLNRGMNSLSQLMKRRAFGYVLTFSIIVILVGSAGMYTFEKGTNSAFNSYGTSLWRTAMLVMSVGTDWPITTEGRILCFIIAIYGLAVFGYITATLATFFIGRDAEDKSTEIAGSNQIEELKKEIILLKKELEKVIKTN